MASDKPPEPVAVLRGSGGDITCVAFRPMPSAGPTRATDAQLCTGDGAGAVAVWSLATRRAVLTFRHHEHSACALGTGPVDAAAEATTVHKPAAAAARLPPRGIGGGGVLALAFASRDGLVTQGRDQRVAVWDLAALLAAAGRTGRVGDATLLPRFVVALFAVPQFGFCNIGLLALPHCGGGAAGDGLSSLGGTSCRLIVADDGGEAQALHCFAFSLSTAVPAASATPATWSTNAVTDVRSTVLPMASGLDDVKLGQAMSLALVPASSRASPPGNASGVEAFVAVGFESGHVVVFAFAFPVDAAAPPSSAPAAAAPAADAFPSLDGLAALAAAPPPLPAVRASHVLRLSVEPVVTVSLAPWRSPQQRDAGATAPPSPRAAGVSPFHVVAASADGTVQGYAVDFEDASPPVDAPARAAEELSAGGPTPDDFAAAAAADADSGGAPDVAPGSTTTMAAGTAERLWERKYANGVGAAMVRPADGRLAVLGLWDQAVALLDAHAGTPVATLHLHAGAISAVAALDAPATLALRGRARAPHHGSATGVAVASRDGSVSLWDLDVGL